MIKNVFWHAPPARPATCSQQTLRPLDTTAYARHHQQLPERGRADHPVRRSIRQQRLYADTGLPFCLAHKKAH